MDLDDVVPVYATSIEGATGIILSPEADKVPPIFGTALVGTGDHPNSQTVKIGRYN